MWYALKRMYHLVKNINLWPDVVKFLLLLVVSVVLLLASMWLEVWFLIPIFILVAVLACMLVIDEVRAMDW